MTPAWLESKREIPNMVRTLVDNAKLYNCWIYHIKTRIFYTPEEFMAKWSLLYSEGRRGVDNYKEFALKSPYVAIKQRAEWINKANAELQVILTKLETYEAEFKPQK